MYIRMCIYVYIMSIRDVWRGQSTSFFKVTRIAEEYINQTPKRLHEEHNTTATLVDVTFTATLTEESVEVNNDLLLTENQKERSTTYLALKLLRLKYKQARSVSHKEFSNWLYCRKTYSYWT